MIEKWFCYENCFVLVNKCHNRRTFSFFTENFTQQIRSLPKIETIKKLFAPKQPSAKLETKNIHRRFKFHVISKDFF